MCYRFFLERRDLARSLERLRARLAADCADRFNIPPGGPVPAVRQAPDGTREASLLRWGLVPRWADDPAAVGVKLANARGETVGEKPSFRDAFRKRRCVLPASGFFEWETALGGRKLPWLLRRRDGAPLLFAGLWETWTPAEGPPVESCTIITTAPNELLSPFHDRMPVILPEEACDAWLDPACRTPEALRPLLAPLPGRLMTAVRVSPHVNSVAHDDPSCIAPIGDEIDAGGRITPRGQMELGL